MVNHPYIMDHGFGPSSGSAMVVPDAETWAMGNLGFKRGGKNWNGVLLEG
jgi:hypothetical protein